MLAERGGAEDVEAAKAMLKESIAASDRIGLGLYARLARQKLGESHKDLGRTTAPKLAGNATNQLDRTRRGQFSKSSTDAKWIR